MPLKISQAFVKTFIDSNFGIDIAHENSLYKPINGMPYAELRVLQNDVTPFSLADSNQTDGVFRIVLRYETGKGSIIAKTKADEIFAIFKIGAKISYSGVTATITKQTEQPGVVEDGWYKLVLTLNYKSFLTR